MEDAWPDSTIIIEECPNDILGIRKVNQAAFRGDYEADVVDRLRLNCVQILSLVAKKGDQVVGHILFSPVAIIQNEGWTIDGMGLGPLAVHPDHQGLGIGSALCRAGLQRMKGDGHPYVVVLGHPDYYPRFGFTPASNYGIKCAYEGVPQDAFMICIFNPQQMEGVRGRAFYREEFGDVD